MTWARASTRYRAALREVEDLEGYLAAHSGLPGPRGNIELALAAAEELDHATLERLARSEDEFEAFCGVVGLGRAVADGRRDLVVDLRRHANDPRWRVREAVAMALQRWGDADLPAMLDEAAAWATGSRLEQRAAAAGTCEPRLLRDPAVVRRVLALLDTITASPAGRTRPAHRRLPDAAPGAGLLLERGDRRRPGRRPAALRRWRHSRGPRRRLGGPREPDEGTPPEGPGGEQSTPPGGSPP